MVRLRVVQGVVICHRFGKNTGPSTSGVAGFAGGGTTFAVKPAIQ